MIEGPSHPDRDAQFQHINRRVKAFQRRGQPVVSVDAKKKELVGQFRHGGREWQPTGQPEEVEVYDFAKKDLGKVLPYTAFMTRRPTPDGSAWGSITTRPSSPWSRSGGGGGTWAAGSTRRRSGC